MHHNVVANPTARYRKRCIFEKVFASPMVNDTLHLLEICALGDGAAALILDTEEQVRRCGRPLVRITACVIATGQFNDSAPGIFTVLMIPQQGVAH